MYTDYNIKSTILAFFVMFLLIISTIVFVSPLLGFVELTTVAISFKTIVYLLQFISSWFSITYSARPKNYAAQRITLTASCIFFIILAFFTYWGV